MGLLTPARTLAIPRRRFLPPDLPGLKVWLSADQIAPGDGSAVAELAPRVGHPGLVFTQPTAANRPTWEADEVNGKPVLRFDGSNDYLSAESTAAQANLDFRGHAMFFVLKTTTYVQNAGVYAGVSVNGGLDYDRTDSWIVAHGNSAHTLSINIDYNGALSMNPAAQAQAFAVWSIVIQRGNVANEGRIYRNGTSLISAGWGAEYVQNVARILILGARYPGSIANYGNTDLAELVHYEAPSPAGFPESWRRSVEKYLGEKYALTVAV